MKKTFFILLFVILIGVLNAQFFDVLSMISQSAITEDNEIYLRTPFMEELIFLDIEALTFIENQIQSSVFYPHNEYEMRAIVKAPDMDLNYIGFRAEIEMFSLLLPWQIASSQTSAANMYIKAGILETGLDDPVLDLKEQSFALTETGIWVKIENVASEYPFMTGLLTNFYAYAAVILNPDSIIENIDWENIDWENLDLSIFADLTAYAIINLNIPAILEAGLFKVPFSVFLDPSSIDLSNFFSIGNIHSTISEGAMMLGIDFDTLASDPDFGEWPSMSNSLLVIPIIINIQNPMTNLAFNLDIGSPTLVYCSSYRVRSQTNTTPEITLGLDTPRYKVISYRNVGGFYPIVAEFRGDGYVIQGLNVATNFYYDASFTFTHLEDIGDGEFVFSTDNINFVTLEFNLDENDDTIPLPETSFSIYPNPIRNDSFSIEFNTPLTSDIKIDIFNIRGQKVKSVLLSENISSTLTLNNIGLPSGVYFVRVQNNDFMQVQRILMIQ